MVTKPGRRPRAERPAGDAGAVLADDAGLPGLPQAKLAEQLGVGRSAVAQWERDTTVSPTVGHLTKIALATAVSFEWLATGRGARVIGGEGEEAPAFVLDYVAQSESEERLLVAFRSLDALAQVPVLEQVEALANRKG